MFDTAFSPPKTICVIFYSPTETKHPPRTLASRGRSGRGGGQGQQLPDGGGALLPHPPQEPLRRQEAQEGRDARAGAAPEQSRHMGGEGVPQVATHHIEHTQTT